MAHDGLEQLESPRVVQLRRDQTLLNDSEYRRVLALRNHLRCISGEESLQKFNEAGDAALLLPDCGREEEGEERAVLFRDSVMVEFEHLREDLEGIWDVL